MGQVIWILAAAAAVGGMIGLTSLSDQKPEPVRSGATAAVPNAEQNMIEVSGSSGSALAAAAFGLSALQPDTYNGELVLEIIDASHLDEAEKMDLAADLAAAEAGRADLDDVLEDVRVALAVE
ncbi:MAG: hypothetical protein RIE24_10575 [Silicimonas sp.]